MVNLPCLCYVYLTSIKTKNKTMEKRRKCWERNHRLDLFIGGPPLVNSWVKKGRKSMNRPQPVGGAVHKPPPWILRAPSCRLSRICRRIQTPVSRGGLKWSLTTQNLQLVSMCLCVAPGSTLFPDCLSLKYMMLIPAIPVSIETKISHLLSLFPSKRKSPKRHPQRQTEPGEALLPVLKRQFLTAIAPFCSVLHWWLGKKWVKWTGLRSCIFLFEN